MRWRLRKDVKHPFPPESDEVAVTKPDETPKPKGTPPAMEPKEPAKDINKELNKEPAQETEKTSQLPPLLLMPKPMRPQNRPTTMTIDFDGIADARRARAAWRG